MNQKQLARSRSLLAIKKYAFNRWLSSVLLSLSLFGIIAGILSHSALTFAQARPVAVRAGEVELGVASPNLLWLDSSKITANLQSISSINAEWVRTDLRSSHPNMIARFTEAVKLANSKEIKFLALVIQEPEDYAPSVTRNNNNPTFTQLCRYEGGSLPLSQFDDARFRNRLVHYMEALQSAGAHIEAFEIGNEVNWVCFNGDFTIGVPATAEITQKVGRAYLRMLSISHDVIKRYFPNAEILTFGSAYISDQFAPYGKVAGTAILDTAGKDQIERYVDGICVHFYPEPHNSDAQISAILRPYASYLSRKPAWLTEWGYPRQLFTDERQRLNAYRKFVTLLNKLGGVKVAVALNYEETNADYRLFASNGQPLLSAEIFSSYSTPAR